MKSITWDNTTGKIEGTFKGDGGQDLHADRPGREPRTFEVLPRWTTTLSTADLDHLSRAASLSLLSIILPFALILGFFAWMQMPRRASDAGERVSRSVAPAAKT